MITMRLALLRREADRRRSPSESRSRSKDHSFGERCSDQAGSRRIFAPRLPSFSSMHS
jgi:hypothetical protein